MYANDRVAHSQLGYGTWQSAPGEVALGIVEALKVGYRHLVCPKPHAVLQIATDTATKDLAKV
jgi:hypothetical protein